MEMPKTIPMKTETSSFFLSKFRFLLRSVGENRLDLSANRIFEFLE